MGVGWSRGITFQPGHAIRLTSKVFPEDTAASDFSQNTHTAQATDWLRDSSASVVSDALTLNGENAHQLRHTLQLCSYRMITKHTHFIYSYSGAVPVGESSRWGDLIIAICSYENRNKSFKKGSVVSKGTADVIIEPAQQVYYCKLSMRFEIPFKSLLASKLFFLIQ